MNTPTTLERAFEPIEGAPNALISRPGPGVTSSGDEPEIPNNGMQAYRDLWLEFVSDAPYTEGYNKLYPGATQVVIQNHRSWWLTREETSIRSIAPVAKLIQDANPTQTLIHVFSNGGCNSLVNVSDGLHRLTSKQDLPLPAGCIIFDSCPGETHWGRGAHAFTGGIKNHLVKLLAQLLILCAFCVAWVFSEVAGRGDPSLYMRKRLLSPTTLPHNAPRTFVYSKEDELVQWNAVEAHAALAKKRGVDVTLELYESTPHVNHLKADPERYWTIVSDAWQRAAQPS
ncbi:hypothetical protein FRC05_003084 [Tulasnella sp. 425]|nr:hypothetical protein FRC05_003084 [Tulasnella sp. 425]